MNIQIIDTKSPLWSETLKRIRHDVYHFPAYVELEAQRLKALPEAMVIGDGDRIFFLPYLLRPSHDASLAQDFDWFDVISPYGYPGFLLSESAMGSPDFLALALEALQDNFYSRRICSAFLRLHPILNGALQSLNDHGLYSEQGETVSIDLTLPKSEIWSQTRKGHKSSIKKCKRLGFEARIVPYGEYLEAFLEIYQETMDRAQAQAQYYFDRAYFDGLSQLGESVHLCIAERDGVIVSGIILFESCGIVQAHLGGTKTEFIQQSPFMEVLDYVRMWAKDRGNQYFHLGGGVGGKRDNLYTFKSGFSQQRHHFGVVRLVTDQSLYRQLVEHRAKDLNTSSEALLESGFFPAYRASI